MPNPVSSRIAEFLKEIAPFSLLKEVELARLCEKVVIRYAMPPEVIFRKGDLPGEFVYIVHEGAVNLEAGTGENVVLREQCGEGDLFGLRPVIAGDNYQLTAEVIEETLLYQVRVEDLKQMMRDEPEVTWFLAQQFAGGVYRNFQRSSGSTHGDGSNPEPFMELSSMEFSKSPITCSPEAVIRDVAVKMRIHNIGSMIVADSMMRPIGIVTDRDLRNDVVTGDVSMDLPVKSIMSAPVITSHPGTCFAAIQIAMMRHQVHHICLTEDGTAGSRIVGVISEHDLLVQQGYHPAILLREIKRCKEGDALRRVRSQAEIWMERQLAQGTHVFLVSEVITEINDALTARAIELSLEEVDQSILVKEKVKWCWLSLGSAGRGEQLLRTDQDHALVYTCSDEEASGDVRDHLLSVAREASLLLEECGYPFCPSDMMASNPKWCLTLEAWKDQFAQWIHEPTEENLMYCGIFFDFRPVYGDVPLAEELGGHICDEIDRKDIFLPFLAKAAIHTPPPLTFFRNFLVEKRGEHKDRFDLKARALMPLVDAARMLILEKGKLSIRNTGERFQYLADTEPQNRELFDQATGILDILMRLRAEQGIAHMDQGRYVDPKNLDKIERFLLRNSFQVISDLQELLSVRFRLSAFM